MKRKKLLKVGLVSLTLIVVGLLVIPGPVKDIAQKKYHEYNFHRLLANGDKDLKENLYGPFVFVLLNSDDSSNSKVMQYRNDNPVGILELDGKYDYINLDKLGDGGGNVVVSNESGKLSKVTNLKDDSLEVTEYIQENIPKPYIEDNRMYKSIEYQGEALKDIKDTRISSFLEIGKDENGIKFEISDFAKSFNAGDNSDGI